MKIIKDIIYSECKNCQLDVYLPESDKFSTLVYFHGGGLINGDKNEAAILSEYLVKHNVAVVSANYRMYPDAKFPEYIEDAAECVSWVFSNIKKYGNCENIYVGGSSAGAYISMLLSFDSRYLSLHGLSHTDIKGYVHNAGQPTTHFRVLEERGIDSRRVIIDEAAPLYYIGMENTYSKMLFVVSDNDMKNRLEQIMLTKTTLSHFGHEVDDEILKGNHCECVEKKDEIDESIFGKLIYSYIVKWEQDI